MKHMPQLYPLGQHNVDKKLNVYYFVMVKTCLGMKLWSYMNAIQFCNSVFLAPKILTLHLFLLCIAEKKSLRNVHDIAFV